jgi:hypothetical protein
MAGLGKGMPWIIVAWFLAGSAAEVLNSRVRRWSVERLGFYKRRLVLLWFVAGLVLRLALTVFVLVLAFRHDLVSGVAALVGYWICRWVMVWRVTRGLSGHTLSGG